MFRCPRNRVNFSLRLRSVLWVQLRLCAAPLCPGLRWKALLRPSICGLALKGLGTKLGQGQRFAPCARHASLFPCRAGGPGPRGIFRLVASFASSASSAASCRYSSFHARSVILLGAPRENVREEKNVNVCLVGQQNMSRQGTLKIKMQAVACTPRRRNSRHRVPARLQAWGRRHYRQAAGQTLSRSWR
jgi:hypothetical protein